LLLVAAGSIFIVSLLLYFVPGALRGLLGENTVEGWVAQALGAFAAGLFGGLLAIGRGRLRSRGHRHLIPDARYTLRRDPRPPVLYLRPFSIDPVTAQPQVSSPLSPAVRTAEEQLSRALAPVGPLIAIGQPGELPWLGAARLYPPDDWRRTALQLMKAARLVVLGAGHGDGFLWELRHAVTMLPPTRLVMLVPFDPRHYLVFRETVRAYFPRPLPDYPPGKPVVEFGIKGAVYFGPDWTPYFVRFDRPRGRDRRRRSRVNFEKAFAGALRPAFDVCGQEAQAWWRAAAAGDPRAARILAEWRERAGRGQEDEDRRGQTAETGHPETLQPLAEWLQRASRGQEDEAWYRRAAETGHPEAMWALAEWLERAGRGQKAEWLERFRIEPTQAPSHHDDRSRPG